MGAGGGGGGGDGVSGANEQGERECRPYILWWKQRLFKIDGL